MLGGVAQNETHSHPCMSFSIILSTIHTEKYQLSLWASISLSFTIHAAILLTIILSPLGTICVRVSVRDRAGRLLVDNVCKFVREHPVLCNKYTALFCLLFCPFISFHLSKAVVLPKKRETPLNLHPPWFALHILHPSIHPSFHPFLHPTLAWLRVVSCREAVNNLSALVVLPCTAPLFWMKNILRGTRNPHRLWQRIWSIACTALLINTCSVCQIINSCILLLTLNATGIQKDA